MRDLWSLTIQRNLAITPHWLPSAENPADTPSRRPWSPLAHSMLHPQVVESILGHFAHPTDHRPAFLPQVDWMAEKDQAQLPRFVTPLENIFAQDLPAISPGWVNPPWHLIPPLLNFWASQPPSAQALAILPYKPRSPWWVLKEQMQVGG